MFKEDEDNSIVKNSREKFKRRSNEEVIEKIKKDIKKKARIDQ